MTRIAVAVAVLLGLILAATLAAEIRIWRANKEELVKARNEVQRLIIVRDAAAARLDAAAARLDAVELALARYKRASAELQRCLEEEIRRERDSHSWKS
jgi:hypothetical protein